MSAKHAKPNFSQSQVSETVKRLYRLTPSEIRPLPSYDDQNFYVASAEGGEYVLKIMNSEDSKNSTIIEVQTYAMSFLHQNGLPAQTAVPTTSGQLMSLVEMGMTLEHVMLETDVPDQGYPHTCHFHMSPTL